MVQNKHDRVFNKGRNTIKIYLNRQKAIVIQLDFSFGLMYYINSVKLF